MALPTLAGKTKTGHGVAITSRHDRYLDEVRQFCHHNAWLCRSSQRFRSDSATGAQSVLQPVGASGSFEAFKDQAERRLDILEAAVSRNDLLRLTSNRFEALSGDREGQFSIRINQQWRVCFEWPDAVDRPFHIEITDYHS